MKKSLIFWFAAVTCAALFLVGCESPTNGEKGAAGANAPGTLPSGATPAMLAALFETTDTVIVGLDLAAGTFTVPAGKTLEVAGNVALSTDTIINAYAGTLAVPTGSTIGGSSTVFIVRDPAAYTGKITSGVVPPTFTGTLSGSTPALTAPAVFESLGIGGSGEITAAQFATFATSYPAYVIGDVTIDASSAANLTSAKLVVYGRIKAAGAGPLTLGSDVVGSLTATGNLTLVGIDNLDELDTATSTVTSPDTTVDLDSLDSGTGGKLVLTGNVTQVDIDGGTGNIEFNTGTPAFASSASSFGNTGLTTFKANAGSDNVALTFAGPVAVEGNFTRTTGGAYSFGGDVTVTDTKALTLGGTDTVTLAKGKSIKVGSDAVLTAGAANAVLLPVTGAVLTAAAKKLTLGTANLTLTSGALAVEAGAELALSTDLTVTAADATLVLTGAASTGGAKLSGAGKVVLGNANIIGSTGGWQAVGEGTTITLTATGANAVSLTGTGATPKLVGGTGGVISTGSNSTYSAVTVQLLEIDLTAGGSIVIPYNSTASTIVLKGGALGKLTFNSANITTTSHYTKVGTNKASVTGSNIVVKAATNNDGAVAGSIAGGDSAGTNDATITGLTSTNDVTLKNDSTFADS